MEQIQILKSEVHPKGWGEEVWIINTDKYCGKVLKFKAEASFSDHFHVLKDETWFVLEGELELMYYNLENAEKMSRTITVGDVIHIPPHQPHKLRAVTESRILEVSTTHDEHDSYRIGKGDSQATKQ